MKFGFSYIYLTEDVCYAVGMAGFKIDLADFRSIPLSLGESARFIARGGEGAVFAEDKTVVKFFFNHNHKDNPAAPNLTTKQKVSREYETLQLFHTRNDTGVAIPQPVEAIVFDRTVQSGPIHYYIAALRMSRLEGRPPDLETFSKQPALLDRFLFDAGYLIGKLHRVAESLQPAASTPYTTRSAEFFSAVEQLGHPSQFITQDEIKILNSLHEERGQKNPELLLVHGDPGPHNMLVDSDNRITGIVDWSSARLGPREDDFLHYAIPYPIYLKPLATRFLTQSLRGYFAATGLNLAPESIRLSAALTLGWQILGRERAEQTGGTFKEAQLAPFKELLVSMRGEPRCF